MHRAKPSLLESADGSMATAAAGEKKKRVEQNETRIHLTPTGLLMEGGYTNYVSISDMGMLRQLTGA